MKKLSLFLALAMSLITTWAAERQSRAMVGTGLLYPNFWDVTIAYEREGSYHNAWEFFANGALRWSTCQDCGHVCPDSFWKGHRTWGVGIAWKPCVVRCKNSHGNLRVGASLGSDLEHVLGGFHIGYEHDYILRNNWQFYWQVKTDLMVKDDPLLRTGIGIGVKIPI